MTMTGLADQPAHRPFAETDAERDDRITREAHILARAEADIDAGRGIEDDDLEAWLDTLDHDANAPQPVSLSHR